MDFGKTHIPAIALALGAITKFILNIILISNPNIGIFGAGISSIVCQIIAFAITYIVLNKNIKIKLEWIRMIILPIIAGAIMGILAYLINMGLSNVISPKISTIISICFGALIYCAEILLFRVLKKEDIIMLPFGSKIYGVLNKVGIYK